MDWIQDRIHKTLMSNPRMVTAERNAKIVIQCTVQLQWTDILKKHYIWTLLSSKIHNPIPFWSPSDIVGIIETVFTITPVLLAKPHSVSILNDSFCMDNFCQLLLDSDSLICHTSCDHKTWVFCVYFVNRPAVQRVRLVVHIVVKLYSCQGQSKWVYFSEKCILTNKYILVLGIYE